MSLRFVPCIQLASPYYCFKWWLGAKQVTSHCMKHVWNSLLEYLCFTRPQSCGHINDKFIADCIFAFMHVCVCIHKVSCIIVDPMLNVKGHFWLTHKNGDIWIYNYETISTYTSASCLDCPLVAPRWIYNSVSTYLTFTPHNIYKLQMSNQ